jgi:hypothetical protein
LRLRMFSVHDLLVVFLQKWRYFMMGLKEVIKNHLGQDVFLVNESWVHINEKHPEICIKMIRRTIADPDIVLMSEVNPSSEIYFLLRNTGSTKIRYIVVIVKCKNDGLWVSTAMTKNKVSGGIEIYRRWPC